MLPCVKWKLCWKINTGQLIANDKLNITEKILKEKEIVYAAQSSKHKVLNIGNTGEQLSKIDQEIANLENIFTNINDNFNVTILQSNTKTTVEQRYHKVKWNCRLKT